MVSIWVLQRDGKKGVAEQLTLKTDLRSCLSCRNPLRRRLMFSFLLPLIRPGSLGKLLRLPFPDLDCEKLLCLHLWTDRFGVLSFSELAQPANSSSFLVILKFKKKATLYCHRGRSSPDTACISALSPFPCSLPTG